MNLVTELKQLNTDHGDVDELIALKAGADGMVATYAGFQLDQPQWLADARENLDREIKARHRDQLEKELREAERDAEGLKSATERREENAARIAKLKAALGK